MVSVFGVSYSVLGVLSGVLGVLVGILGVLSGVIGVLEVLVGILVGVERNRNQVFVPERDILFPYFKFRFRLSRYRISGRKKAGKFVIL